MPFSFSLADDPKALRAHRKLRRELKRQNPKLFSAVSGLSEIELCALDAELIKQELARLQSMRSNVIIEG